MSASNTVAVKRPPLYARTVATALEKHFQNRLDGVRVYNEDDWCPNPGVVWPVDTNPLFPITFERGFSEGYLFYVYAKVDRYKPTELTLLLVIKCLNNAQGASAFLPELMAFFENIYTLWPPVESGSPVEHAAI